MATLGHGLRGAGGGESYREAGRQARRVLEDGEVREEVLTVFVLAIDLRTLLTALYCSLRMWPNCSGPSLSPAASWRMMKLFACFGMVTRVDGERAPLIRTQWSLCS